MSITLNRLNITGPLTKETPRIVVLEVTESAGITSDDPTDLSQVSWPIVFQPFNDDALRKVVRYVNPRTNWSARDLLVAFHHLVYYARQEAYQTIPPSFESGPQTPGHPNSFNACILYRYCREYGINTRYTTSLAEMSYAVRMLTRNREDLRSDILRHLETLPSKGTLINLLLALPRISEEGSPPTGTEDPRNRPAQPRVPPPIPPKPDKQVAPSTPSSGGSAEGNKPPPEGARTRYQQLYSMVVSDSSPPTYENLATLSQSFSLSNKTAITSAEAIVYGCLLYQRDISENENIAEAWRTLVEKYSPIQPYHSLLNYTSLPIPLSVNTSKSVIYELKRRFNIKLPRSCYTDPLLNELALREGYNTTEIAESDPYYLLQIAMLSLTFYPGPPVKGKNSYTVISCEKISELPKSKLVSYGVQGDAQFTYTYEELEQTFNSYQSFQDPASTSNEIFSTLAINKLARLANTTHPNLVKAITNIKRLIKCRFEEYTTFHEKFKGAPGVEELINLLHEIAMCMRGWTGRGPLPISQVRQDAVDIRRRTEDALYTFYQKIEGIPLAGDLLKLPLLRYRQDTFVASINSTEGLTIGDRLKLVAEGNTTDNMSSCIRLSSMWIAATSYYLMVLFEMTTPYNINELTTIS